MPGHDDRTVAETPRSAARRAKTAPPERYQRLEMIGEGGMGRVYRAHDTVLGRDVALKMIEKDVGEATGEIDRFVREARAKVQELKKQIEKLKAKKPAPADAKEQKQELERQIAEIEKNTPHYKTPRAPAVDDAALFVLANGPNATKLEYKPGEAVDLHVHIRGNPSNLGPVVPRRFLTVLSSSESRPFQHGSGRLDLAQSIVSGSLSLVLEVSEAQPLSLLLLLLSPPQSLLSAVSLVLDVSDEQLLSRWYASSRGSGWGEPPQ